MDTHLPQAILKHQTTLLCVFFTICIGTVAGFQGLVATIPKEWAMALRTLYGGSYIVARGLMPAILYVVLHRLHLLSVQNPIGEAIILGGGSETALRSRVLLAFKPAAGSVSNEDAKGPLDLIFWFQDFFIKRASGVLANKRMDAVRKYYAKPGLTLIALADKVRSNAGALDNQAKTAKDEADTQERDYIAARDRIAPVLFTAEQEQNWNRKLGYALYNSLTIDNFRSLSREITK